MSTEKTKSGCALVAVIGMIGGGFSAAVKSGPKAGSKGIKPLVKPAPVKESLWKDIPIDDVLSRLVPTNENDRKRR